MSDATENSSGEYRPTQGVRILEFELQNLNVNNRNLKAEIELWDCSGDHKYVTAVQNIFNHFYILSTAIKYKNTTILFFQRILFLC